MALYDNKHWLLSHIRDSFITSDDTGMCEVVMVSDNFAKQIPVGKYDCYPGVKDVEDEDEMASQSFEIYEIYSSTLPRARSNTAQRLEKMDKEKDKAAQTLHVKWVTNPVPLTDEEKAELFPRKDMEAVREKLKKEKRVSLLTEILERTTLLPQNPFQEYCRYDGNAQVGVPIKKYNIFITMLPEEKRNFPMKVTIISSAKISDLIGLICYKCSVEYPETTLKENINCYGLYIAEDDGEVDGDFPCLDSNETVAKFGFTSLALVERTEMPYNASESTSRPIVIRESTVRAMLPFASRDDGDLAEDSQEKEKVIVMEDHILAMEAASYQSFNVFILNKLRARTEVHLGISDDRIEIYPVLPQKAVSKFWGKQREIIHPMKNVVACNLLDSKSPSRTLFRLVYDQEREDRSYNYKHNDFEAKMSVASKIMEKINYILELHQSAKRKEYLALNERKSHRRKNSQHSFR